jgi:hypothetical protein
MENKTALQQFIEWGNQMIGDHPAKTLSFYEAIDKAEELLEVEKEQIMDAYKDGLIQHPNDFLSQEQYYNKTYNK